MNNLKSFSEINEGMLDFMKGYPEDLKKTYLKKLENKYENFKKFQSGIEFGTEEKRGSFNAFINYMLYFIKYMRKIIKLNIPEEEKIDVLKKYAMEIKKAIDVFKGIGEVNNFHIFDLKKIYNFHNEYSDLFGFNKERYNFRLSSLEG